MPVISKRDTTVPRLLPADYEKAQVAARKEAALKKKITALEAENAALKKDLGEAQQKVNETTELRRRHAFQRWLRRQVGPVFDSRQQIEELCPQLFHSWKFATVANRTAEELTIICQGDIGLAYELYDRVQDAVKQGGIPEDGI